MLDLKVELSDGYINTDHSAIDIERYWYLNRWLSHSNYPERPIVFSQASKKQTVNYQEEIFQKYVNVIRLYLGKRCLKGQKKNFLKWKKYCEAPFIVAYNS